MLVYNMADTHTTGKTLGKTTLASAKYSYRIRWWNSSVVYFTSVACNKKINYSTWRIKKCHSLKKKMNHLNLTFLCYTKKMQKNFLYTISNIIPPARGFQAQDQVSTHQYSEEQRLDLRVCENILIQEDVGLGHGHFA